jgi:hypothetical protein
VYFVPERTILNVAFSPMPVNVVLVTAVYVSCGFVQLTPLFNLFHDALGGISSVLSATARYV